MQRIIGLFIAILLLGYGLVRIGVGALLMAQTLDLINFTDLAEAVSEVKLFIDARTNDQIFSFSVSGYFGYILVMGVLLATGAAGAIARNRWGYTLLGLYLAMHAALFVNFQEVNPKNNGAYIAGRNAICTILSEASKVGSFSCIHITSRSNGQKTVGRFDSVQYFGQ